MRPCPVYSLLNCQSGLGEMSTEQETLKQFLGVEVLQARSRDLCFSGEATGFYFSVRKEEAFLRHCFHL